MTPDQLIAALLFAAAVLIALPFALSLAGPDEEPQGQVSEGTRRRL